MPIEPETSGEQRAYDFGYLFGIGSGQKYRSFFARKKYLLKDEVIEKSDESSRKLFRSTLMRHVVKPALVTIASEEGEESKEEKDAILAWFWTGTNDGFDQGAGILGEY